MASYSGDRGEKNYVAYIDSDNCENDIRVSAIDLTTRKQIRDYYECIPAANVKQFINDIPSKFRGFKAIILSVFGFHSDDYKNNLEFRNAIREKLQLINVQFQFIKIGTMMYCIPLCAAGISLSVGENVVKATLIRSNFDIINFVLTEKGYIIFSNRRSIPYDENEDVKDIREKLTREFKPKELIIVADGDDRLKLEKMKDAHFVTCSCYTLTKYTYQLLIDYSKLLLDKTSVKTLLAPVVDNHYVLTKFLGDKQQRVDLVVDSRQLLPVSKTLLLPKSKFTFGATCIDRYVEKPVTLLVVMKKDENRLVISAFPKTSVETIKQDEKYHGIKFTFELDINNFPSFTFRPMILKGIKMLPQTLDGKMLDSRIPVIGFFKNLSVICISKNGKNYQFVKDWGGMYGSDLYISFDEEKQKYGEAAFEMLETKPSFVVYDLLKIMSMPPSDIDIDKTWHFDITKDSENEVLIEFDNFDGQKSAATPKFLMALLLKQHLKAIKDVTGEKPKELGFCFFKVDDSDKERLKNQIIETFELLQIEPQFIDI